MDHVKELLSASGSCSVGVAPLFETPVVLLHPNFLYSLRVVSRMCLS